MTTCRTCRHLSVRNGILTAALDDLLVAVHALYPAVKEIALDDPDADLDNLDDAMANARDALGYTLVPVAYPESEEASP